MRRLYPDPAEQVDLEASYEHPPGVVRANFVASLDGAATVEGRSGGLSTQADKDLFMLLRRLCDVIVVGASTVRKEDYGPSSRPLAVLTASLDLDPASRFFSDPDRRPFVVTTTDSDPVRRKDLGQVAEVITLGTGRVDCRAMVAAFAERGLTRVLTEGGPALFAELAAADRLDELCLTLSPHLVGGHSKRISDGAVHDPPAHMQPVHVLEEDGFLFLRYRSG